MEDEHVLSLATACRMIEGLAAVGVAEICFTGGEPLLRKDLFDLIAAAKSNGLRTLLMTNGLLVTERKARRVVDSGLDVLFVSLDAANPQLNDELRGMNGYYSLAMAAIDNVKSMRRNARPNIVLRSTISKLNMGELTGLATLAMDKSIEGFDFRLAQHFEGTQLVVGSRLRIHPEDLTSLQNEVATVVRQFRDILYASPSFYAAQADNLFKADAGSVFGERDDERRVYIDARGQFFAGVDRTRCLGSLGEQTVSEIYNNSVLLEDGGRVEARPTPRSGMKAWRFGRKLLKLAEPILNGAKLF